VRPSAVHPASIADGRTPQKIHHEDTKDTKGTKEKQQLRWLFFVAFVSFVPSW
jgi:hypothetical protein